MYQEFNSVYCIGVNCDRAGSCKYHYVKINFAATTDWSTYGSGSINSVEDSVRYACGPHSDPPYEKFKPLDPGYFCVKDDDLLRHDVYGPQCSTIEIVNCREISVKLDNIEVDTKVPLEYIDQVQEIIINGNRFVRVEPKQMEVQR